MTDREVQGYPPNVRTVRNWLHGDIPQERFIEPILDVLFGSDEALAKQRRELHDLWLDARRLLARPNSGRFVANNAVAEDMGQGGPSDWELAPARNIALGLAALYLHQPSASNADTFLLRASLSLAQRRDEIEGFPVLLGLKQAHLLPDYEHCQPVPPMGAEQVVFSGGVFEITGPHISPGHLVGEPLVSTTLGTMQCVGDGPPSVTLTLRSRPSDLDVIPDNPDQPIAAVREKILKRFLQECQIEDTDRFITWSRASMKRKIPT